VANSKNQKPAAVRSNTYLPKAGPKSMHGGKKKASGVAKNNEPYLFDRVRSDKQRANDERHRIIQQQKQQALDSQFARLAAQASLAKRLALSDHSYYGEVRRITELVMDEFATAMPNSGAKFQDASGMQCTRTAYAEQVVFQKHGLNLSEDSTLIKRVRSAVRTFLPMAFNQLNSTSPSSKDVSRELVTA